MKAAMWLQPRPRRLDSQYKKKENPKGKDENEEETLNETLDLSGIPLTLKIGNPQNGALPLLL